MRSIKVLAGAAALLAGVHTASAQTPPLAIEVRPSYSIPTGSWNQGDLLENGFGFGGTVLATVSRQVSVYAGWETVGFSVDDDGAGASTDVTDAGFRAGLSVTAPVPASRRVVPFIEGGLLYNTLEIGATESKAAIGFEAGAGFATSATPQMDVVPVIRYRQHEVEFDTVVGRETVEYILIGIGLRWRL